MLHVEILGHYITSLISFFSNINIGSSSRKDSKYKWYNLKLHKIAISNSCNLPKSVYIHCFTFMGATVKPHTKTVLGSTTLNSTHSRNQLYLHSSEDDAYIASAVTFNTPNRTCLS